MAGGKLSARQKMINLMYLVFIAMIAMNMSKEVLSAFGLMEAKFEESNETMTEMNTKLLANLETKAEEKPAEFATAAEKAKQISTVSDEFFNYLESLKSNITKTGDYKVDPKTGKLPFEEMDKTDILDEAWFTGDRLTKEGQEFMEKIAAYKAEVKKIIGDDVKYTRAIENFEKRFNTTPKTNTDGKKIEWLDYNFKGFPAIASYTKLTALQNDVKVTEANMFNVFLGNTLDEAVSLKNYTAIVIADKSAFFAGEKFQGKVVLGKYANVTPTGLSIGGQSVDLEEAIDSTGAARLDFNVGGVGEQKIDGTFTFLEDGKALEIPIKGNYVVVPRPNSATISADKMNVVYRGVDNPMTISFAGVPDNKVTANGAGLTKASGMGKYTMKPTSGREVAINVSATLDDGSKVNDKAVFRIKDIPKPSGQIAGQIGTAKLPRKNVEIGRIEAVLEDFDFDLPLTVTGFKIKVEGKPSITVSGDRLNGAAKAALSSAPRGSQVQIFEIKSRTNGPAIKPANPLVIELTN
ncbi:gliding motility protein GldM [Subsaximicrobium wynnwilliamsii]|uniref:Gliding motility protein GldM n=1 Tax=Subsaximicrobium wynnwilliamsii TaxID=291179 RepID=A0A5C6ZJ82_9FLAO|nr:gliding motility protein GldM [Subsaximicrobium wynnwilliamsii]TXD84542.1 gliding motility protein GldM [Subsaximicrobium wynnwilliamsii]TXD90224.1 gliding motility protein GldM [Subsaximicrobium wynnwilliamsii]TXE04275.1 gliding motility protein GldM [Subsaximicrobium wynnwilliamsii]